ncbi:MAG: helix-turn-helix domain-containing protein [Bacteroidia bacterium]|jgi:AraC-like DNA-binding protein|nr:helix-turn-helix domain-containing protein [Bacteroidia bacterium]
MTITLNIENIFLIVVILTGVLSAPLLWINKNNQTANRILAAVQIIVAGGLLHNLLLTAGIYETHPQLYFLPLSLRLAIAPLIWWYVGKLTGARQSYLFIHLLPAIFIFAFESYAFTKTVEQKWLLWQKISWYWDHLYFWMYQLQLSIYLLLSLKQLRKWKQRVENQFSLPEKIALGNVRKLLLGFFILVLAGAGWRIVQQSGEIESCFLLPSDMVKGVILLGVGWFSIRQTQIIVVENQNRIQSEPVTESITEIPPVDLTIPSAESVLAEPVNEELLAKIKNYMIEERPFLNPELSLYQLARALNEPAKQVSFTINRGTGQTFQAFVNSYRVNEVIKQIENGRHKQLTLLAIAFDSGFNSKATFNRVFRAQTGKAPGDFVSNSS